MVEIYVRQNNVDQALRALKKKLQNEGILREMKARASTLRSHLKNVYAKKQKLYAAFANWPANAPKSKALFQRRSASLAIRHLILRI